MKNLNLVNKIFIKAKVVKIWKDKMELILLNLDKNKMRIKEGIIKIKKNKLCFNYWKKRQLDYKPKYNTLKVNMRHFIINL